MTLIVRHVSSATRSSVTAAAVLGFATVLTVIMNGVAVTDAILFAAYVIFGIALPGMLWVRYLRGRAAYLHEDLALGLCVGYCLEMAAYLVARAADVPRLGIVWAGATLILFAAVPSLRRHWHGSGLRVPLGWAWGIVLMLGLLLAYSVASFFTSQPLVGTQHPYVDMAFHLSLIGELRNHVPAVIPFVADEPLAYHWFFYVEAAATSWYTGIEPQTLLYRLELLPMLAGFVVLTAAAAHRLTGSWWNSLAAVAITLVCTVAAPYRWINGSVFDAQTLITTWTSPTNVFGLVLFSGLLLVLFDRFSEGLPLPRREWLLVGLLVLGVSGAKATVLPVLAVGLVAVLGVFALRQRRLHGNAAITLGIVGGALAFATIVLYRGSSGGVRVGLDALRRFPVVAATGAANARGLEGWLMPLLALGLGLIFWGLAWAGVFGLLRRPRVTLADARIVMVLGVCVGALGAMVMLLYPGLSEIYYARSAVGAFGLASATGLAALMPARGRRRPVIAAAASVVIGGAVALAIRQLGPSTAPTLAVDHLRRVLIWIGVPVALLGAAVLVGVLVARQLDRRIEVLRGAAPLLVVALAIGFSLPAEVGVLSPKPQGSAVVIQADGIAAARWLRDHSEPSDLIATNMHCIVGAPGPTCDARNFWVSGYTERRILVEGWAYTSSAIKTAAAAGVSDRTVAFWDPTRLVANDLAFTEPSASTIGALHDRYGVTWLFADLTTADGTGMGEFAQEEFRSGQYAVYKLP